MLLTMVSAHCEPCVSYRIMLKHVLTMVSGHCEPYLSYRIMLNHALTMVDHCGPNLSYMSAVAQLVEHLTGYRSVARRRSHCVVSLSNILYPLLSTGSTKEDPSQHD